MRRRRDNCCSPRSIRLGLVTLLHGKQRAAPDADVEHSCSQWFQQYWQWSTPGQLDYFSLPDAQIFFKLRHL